MFNEGDVYGRISTYRHIQLLANLVNNDQQKGIVPGLIVICILAFGMGFAIMVRTPTTSEKLPILVVIFLAGADGALFLLISL